MFSLFLYFNLRFSSFSVLIFPFFACVYFYAITSCFFIIVWSVACLLRFGKILFVDFVGEMRQNFHFYCVKALSHFSGEGR